MNNAATTVAFAVCFVLASATVPALAQQTADAQIEAFTYDGEGSVDLEQNTLHLWRGEAHEFAVEVAASNDADVDVCLTATPASGGDATHLACERTTVDASGTTAVPVTVERWPSNLTGSLAVTATVETGNGSTVLAETSMDVRVVEADGDPDGDGLANQQEVAVGSSIYDADTDGDDLADGIEVNTYETSPTTVDTDGDGLPDYAEVEIHGTDPNAVDSDEDGLQDAREIELGTSPTNADTDGDELEDGSEVNVYETNATKADTDGDGLDDAAEVEVHETNPNRADTDGDGLNDGLEVTTYGTDPTSVDTDGDGLEDGTEVEEYLTDPTDADTDGDALEDGEEVNTYATDPTDADSDRDGLDDGAEVDRYGTDPTNPDTDGDGVNDRAEVENGPLATSPSAVVAVAGIVVVGGLLLHRSGRGPDVELRRVLPEMDAPKNEQSSTDRGREEPCDGDGAANASGRDDGDGEGDASADDGASVPPAFLSNEEQIHRLLEDHDGQIRQIDVVDETGWSKAKVSRVLSEMAEEGAVVKVDVGKGNLVTRPEDLPDGAERPFNE